jgi:hypothetical protein
MSGGSRKTLKNSNLRRNRSNKTVRATMIVGPQIMMMMTRMTISQLRLNLRRILTKVLRSTSSLRMGSVRYSLFYHLGLRLRSSL